MQTSDPRPAQTPPKPRAARRRRLRRLTLAAAALLIAYLSLLGAWLTSYGQVERARPAQAIVILGAKVEENGEASLMLAARVRHAVALYKRGFAPKIICAGGLGKFPPTEAQAQAALARRLGVPPADLLLEDQSHDTIQNARYSARICRRYGWSRVVVVSDAFHLWRARRDFARVGIVAYTSPAPDDYLDTHLISRLYFGYREALAVTRDLLIFW